MVDMCCTVLASFNVFTYFTFSIPVPIPNPVPITHRLIDMFRVVV